jgi:hypothetical protein
MQNVEIGIEEISSKLSMWINDWKLERDSPPWPYELETGIDGGGVNNANVNHRVRQIDEQRDEHNQGPLQLFWQWTEVTYLGNQYTILSSWHKCEAQNFYLEAILKNPTISSGFFKNMLWLLSTLSVTTMPSVL